MRFSLIKEAALQLCCYLYFYCLTFDHFIDLLAYPVETSSHLVLNGHLVSHDFHKIFHITDKSRDLEYQSTGLLLRSSVRSLDFHVVLSIGKFRQWFKEKLPAVVSYDY